MGTSSPSVAARPAPATPWLSGRPSASEPSSAAITPASVSSPSATAACGRSPCLSAHPPWTPWRDGTTVGSSLISDARRRSRVEGRKNQSGFAILNPRSTMLRTEALTLEFVMVHLRYSVLRPWTQAVVIAVGLLALAGCGGPSLYPVHGKVVWENGAEAQELAGGLVVCESVNGGVGARGDIEKDGSFQLSTYTPGDGALLGQHRVAVTEYSPREPSPPPIMDPAFSSLVTSGLEINVERRTNEVTLKVRRAPQQRN